MMEPDQEDPCRPDSSSGSPCDHLAVVTDQISVDGGFGWCSGSELHRNQSLQLFGSSEGVSLLHVVHRNQESNLKPPGPQSTAPGLSSPGPISCESAGTKTAT